MIVKDVVLGIDIGGTNSAFGLVDVQGNCLQIDSVETLSHRPVEELFGRIFSLVQNWMSVADSGIEIRGIGAGAPNGNYFTGHIKNPPNLGWEDVDLVSVIENYLSVPVRVTNDANAAALGEMKFGAAKGMKNFIEITLGTGLGSGIVLNGELLYGHDGHAGEMGHIIAVPEGRLCNCGRHGCLETYASAGGITQTTIELLAASQRSGVLQNIPETELSAKMISEAAQNGDSLSVEAFRQTAEILGRAMADAAVYFSPEAFILFGGLAQAGDLLFKPLTEYFEKFLMAHYKGKIQIIPSGLAAGQAAILGSAALIWHELTQ